MTAVISAVRLPFERCSAKFRDVMARARTPSAVRRSELNELRRLVRSSTAELKTAVDKCCHDLDVQFMRIAQIQAQLDEVRTVWGKMKKLPRRR